VNGNALHPTLDTIVEIGTTSETVSVVTILYSWPWSKWSADRFRRCSRHVWCM